MERFLVEFLIIIILIVVLTTYLAFTLRHKYTEKAMISDVERKYIEGKITIKDYEESMQRFQNIRNKKDV